MLQAAAGLLESLLDKYSTETDYTTLLPLYRQVQVSGVRCGDSLCRERG